MKRKSKSEKLLEVANTKVPKAQKAIRFLMTLNKYEPTADQRKQIVLAVKQDYDKFVEVMTNPAKTVAPGTFSMS